MLLNTSSYLERSVPPPPEFLASELSLDSTLTCLSLYDCQVEATDLGGKIAEIFDTQPLLPGIIVSDRGEFIGMISRRRFLEYMSRPFGRELFLKRPVQSLYRFAQTDILIFRSDTLIVEAARKSLRRSQQLLYEPVVVKMTVVPDLTAETDDRQPTEVYRLLDVHELLVAQSYIHELATQLLRQQTQSQLIQTEKLASLGRMVAGVAHEIRNPVTCVMGNLGFLVNYSQDIMRLISAYEEAIAKPNATISRIKEEIDFDFLQEDLPEIIRSMQVGSHRLNELVSSLRNFSHMDEANRREANIHECIDSTLLILKNRFKQGIAICKNYGDLPQVSCYSGQLSQVFMNIISNALDALEEVNDRDRFSPTIWIETEVMSACEADNSRSKLIQRQIGDDNQCFNLPSKTFAEAEVSEDKPTWVSIRIADNGPGIQPEIQRRIFETFFTTKPVGKGTGLGLAIGHQIVTEKHGGKLNLYSLPGIGTEFEILLPLL